MVAVIKKTMARFQCLLAIVLPGVGEKVSWSHLIAPLPFQDLVALGGGGCTHSPWRGQSLGPELNWLGQGFLVINSVYHVYLVSFKVLRILGKWGHLGWKRWETNSHFFSKNTCPVHPRGHPTSASPDLSTSAFSCQSTSCSRRCPLGLNRVTSGFGMGLNKLFALHKCYTILYNMIL